MKKTMYKLLFRKIWSNIFGLLGIIVLLLAGSAFFIILSTISANYEETAAEYFDSQHYADITLYGRFTQNDVDGVRDTESVRKAHGRYVSEVNTEAAAFAVISLTEGINVPFLMEGRLPETASECLLLDRSAGAMGISVGDTVVLGDHEVVVTGTCESPEFIYVYNNSVFADNKTYGIIFVTADYFSGEYQEIVLIAPNGEDKDIAAHVNASAAVKMEDQLNYVTYESDLRQIQSFAAIFPTVFAILSAAVIYVLFKRTTTKEHKQIGICKALGITDVQVTLIYVIQAVLVSVIGVALGGAAAMLITNPVISAMSFMFILPTMGFVFYPDIWGLVIVVVLVLCVLSSFLGVYSVLRQSPANAMRPIMPKVRKKKSKRGAFRSLSFNSRYALTSALRNKGRFFTVVLGIGGACTLLIFSLGFHDSFVHSINLFFHDFAQYDFIIDFDPIPNTMAHPAVSQFNSCQKALMVPVEINDKDVSMLVVEEDFDMLRIESQKLSDGIIIPQYYAGIWNVKVGDTLEVEGYSVKIADITVQTLNYFVYVSRDYAENILNELPDVYNVIFANADDVSETAKWLRAEGISFTTLQDGINQAEESVTYANVLIYLMIGCALLLGAAVLYSVGLINLSTREFEYMFMGVMGYSTGKIMTAHLKETVVQMLLGIPMGFVLGNIVLESIKSEFSNDSMFLYPAVFTGSYLLAAIGIILISIVNSMLTARHIGRLDIVEGLKLQED